MNRPKYQHALIKLFVPQWPVIDAEYVQEIVEYCTSSTFRQIKLAPGYVCFIIKYLNALAYFIVLVFPERKHMQCFDILAKIFPAFKMYMRLIRTLVVACFMEHPLIKQKL